MTMTPAPLFVPAPVETVPVPYHRLARTARHRWWRPLAGSLLVLLGVVAAVFGLLIASTIAGILLERPEVDGLPTFGAEGDLAIMLAGLGLMIPVVLVSAVLTQRRRPGTVSSVAGRLRWGWLGWCVLLAVPAMVLTLSAAYGLAWLTDPAALREDAGTWVGWERFAVGMAVVLALVPFQAAAEEYLCRGWIVQAVGSWIASPWPGVVLQAVVFALLHGIGTGWGMADLLVYGLAVGWLTIRTGGLEAGIALHVVNNVAAFGLAAAAGMLAADETAADAGWQLAVADMTVILLFTAAVAWLARRRRVQVTAERVVLSAG